MGGRCLVAVNQKNQAVFRVDRNNLINSIYYMQEQAFPLLREEQGNQARYRANRRRLQGDHAMRDYRPVGQWLIVSTWFLSWP